MLCGTNVTECNSYIFLEKSLLEINTDRSFRGNIIHSQIQTNLKASHNVGKSYAKNFWQQAVSLPSWQSSLSWYKAKWSFLTNDFMWRHDVPFSSPSRYLDGFQSEFQEKLWTWNSSYPTLKSILFPKWKSDKTGSTQQPRSKFCSFSIYWEQTSSS